MTTRFPEPICINKSWFLDSPYIHHTKSTTTVAPVSTSSGWSLFLLSASTVDGSGHNLSWVFYGHPSVPWEKKRGDFKAPRSFRGLFNVFFSILFPRKNRLKRVLWLRCFNVLCRRWGLIFGCMFEAQLAKRWCGRMDCASFIIHCGVRLFIFCHA